MCIAESSRFFSKMCQVQNISTQSVVYKLNQQSVVENRLYYIVYYMWLNNCKCASDVLNNYVLSDGTIMMCTA